MNFLKITVEVDANQLAQRKRIVAGSNSNVLKSKSLRRSVVKRRDTDDEENQGDLYNIEDELRNLCENYNNEIKDSAYFEIVEAKRKNLSLYALIKDNLSIDSLFSNLFHNLELKANSILMEEVTYKEFEDRINFHRKSELCESFGIDSLRGRSDDYIEKVIECSKDINFLNEEKNYIGRDNFFKELKRICASPARKKFYGHPVHYSINTEDFEESQEICETLLKALYQQKRIFSRRFCVRIKGRFY